MRCTYHRLLDLANATLTLLPHPRVGKGGVLFEGKPVSAVDWEICDLPAFLGPQASGEWLAAGYRTAGENLVAECGDGGHALSS
jgi:hypothetical protein